MLYQINLIGEALLKLLTVNKIKDKKIYVSMITILICCCICRKFRDVIHQSGFPQRLINMGIKYLISSDILAPALQLIDIIVK